MAGTISMITVGGKQVGLVGLSEIIEEVKAMQLKADDEIAQTLLQKAKSQNYIPSSIEGDYARSLLREYKRLLGLPVQEEALEGVFTIRILGPGCYACDKMERDVKDIVADLSIAADIQHIRDVKEIAKYGPGIYPALIINNKVYASGKAPPRQKLQKWLEELVNK